MFIVKRSRENPMLIPNKDHYWEASATFNMSTVKRGRSIYGLYRAISGKNDLSAPDQISTIGMAESSDGLHFKERRQFIVPEAEWRKRSGKDLVVRTRAPHFLMGVIIFSTRLFPIFHLPQKVLRSPWRFRKTLNELMRGIW